MVKECICKHKYQDEKHGKDMRVMNPCAKNNKGKYRCTVCGRIH